ncbi:fimbrial protein [Providencia rettgeri]|uniref:fimbrial protein n=1 Tax=Providencia rettgeri TaxID=587 RepID=UPI00313CDFA9
MKFKYLLFCFLIIQFWGNEAFSACSSSNPSGSANGYYNVYVPDDTIILQYDDTSAKVLKSYSITAFTGFVDFATPGSQCYGSVDFNYHANWNNNNPSPSNIPGIAVGVKYLTSGVTRVLPFRYPESFSTGMGGLEWVVDIHKTGPVTSGGVIRSGNLATGIKKVNSGNPLGISIIRFTSNFRIIVTSCSLKNNQSTYNIAMEDWFDSDFPSIGSASDEIDIPITLTCQAGANVKATVTSSAGYADANTGKLNLVGANSAKGIAIQLLDRNDNPIKLNSKISLQDNVPQGDYFFDWTARYIRTGETLTPGTANSNATVNIQYE